MTPARIYLETTMFSFYYEKRTAPPYLEYKAEVRRIFDLIKIGEYEPYTSTYTTDEIAKETDLEKRENMWQLITDYEVKMLEATDEVKRLAALYIQEGAISLARNL
jgi:hypothetical protein